VPGIFVLSSVVAALLALAGLFLRPAYGLRASLPLGLVLGAYFAVALTVSVVTSVRKRWFAGLLLPPVFFGLHVWYGAGTLWALLSNAKSPEAERAQGSVQASNAAKYSAGAGSGL
jgi:hypothetical protein